MKKAILMLLALFVGCFTSWLMGFNFDKRGDFAVFTLMFTSYLVFLAYIFPTKD